MMITKRLGDVAGEIGDADLLLFRRAGLISRAGRGVHSHVAMAAWWDKVLFALEIREFRGGRAVTLESQVRRYPGRIDVYAVDTTWCYARFHRRSAVRLMKLFAGCDYGWWNVMWAGLRHVPVVRLLLKPETDDEIADGRPPCCSPAVAFAARRGGGVDPVPRLSDRLVEPADLARSLLYKYKFTLK